MTDHDLTQIGIEAFGARRRMQQAIAGRISNKKSFHIFNLERFVLTFFFFFVLI
jgi:hypothetical protein